ncbi:hypothetical protein ABK040_007394 [Willaertia magna]
MFKKSSFNAVATKAITFEHLKNHFNLNTFPDYNKISFVRNGSKNNLFYLTKDGKGYTVNQENVELINEDEEITNLDIYENLLQIVKKDIVCNVLENGKIINLPKIDDKFVKIIGNTVFAFLLTEKGKVFSIGENVDYDNEVYGCGLKLEIGLNGKGDEQLSSLPLTKIIVENHFSKFKSVGCAGDFSFLLTERNVIYYFGILYHTSSFIIDEDNYIAKIEIPALDNLISDFGLQKDEIIDLSVNIFADDIVKGIVLCKKKSNLKDLHNFICKLSLLSSSQHFSDIFINVRND